MRDKIRIELSSESRLGWEPFYAVLDLHATAQQIRDAKQRARITGREDMTYRSRLFAELFRTCVKPDCWKLSSDTGSMAARAVYSIR